MNKKTLLFLVVLSFVFIALLIFINLKKDSFNNEKIVIDKDDVLLFEKKAGWGPCPPDGVICYQTTKLYTSGKLIMEGVKNIQTQISSEVLHDFVGKIKSTNIMNIDCPAATILDVSVTYTLNMDNQQKTIRFPGCQYILEDIENQIPIINIQ